MSYYPHGTGTTYPYGTYHPQNPPPYAGVQTAGAYPTTPYQTPYTHTAVGGYGATWPYSYQYYTPQGHTQAPAATVARATTLNLAAPTAAPTPATTVVAPPATPAPIQRQATNSTYSFQSSARETVAAAASGGAVSRNVRKQGAHRGLFTKELRNLMYGFGDDRNPSNDTVNVMEEILIEYIIDVCQVALAPGKKSRLSIEDLRRALSRPADAKKLARMEELLFMQEDIKRARSQFEESDMSQGANFQG